MYRPLLAVIALSGLAACEMPAAAPTMPTENACGAAQLQTLVGQPGSVLDGMRFSQPVRVITPGMMVTMEYSAERLTIEVDETDRISRVACG